MVSLMRAGRNEVPRACVRPEDHVEGRLVDSSQPGKHPNLAFVIDDAARAAARCATRERTMLRHRVAMKARTPSIGASYAVLSGHDPQHVIDLLALRSGIRPNKVFVETLHAVSEPLSPHATCFALSLQGQNCRTHLRDLCCRTGKDD